MSIIQLTDVVKEYKQYQRFSGFWGSFRSLFTRQYTVQRAVDGITCSIEQGEAVSYLGPNGAGKSTMIKMLTGILVPTSGNILVRGTIPHKNRKENARKMGVVFGQRTQLWWDLPVMDSFDLHKDIYKIDHQAYKRNLHFCEELLQMTEFIHKPVRQLSLGQRIRAEIAMALLHEPDILFLDEPTIGLDMEAKDRIRQFLKTVNRENKVTIILTSHDLQDIEEICQRAIIVNKGTLVYDGDLAQLKDQMDRTKKMIVEFETDPGRIHLQGADLVRDEGLVKHFQFDRDVHSAFDLIAELSPFPVKDISLEEPGIEEVLRTFFRQLGGSMA